MAEHGRVTDAAEIGRGLAFPGGLQEQLVRMAAGERPVREAVRAGWARLDELRLLTAALNGSVAADGGRRRDAVARSAEVGLAVGGLSEGGASALTKQLDAVNEKLTTSPDVTIPGVASAVAPVGPGAAATATMAGSADGAAEPAGGPLALAQLGAAGAAGGLGGTGDVTLGVRGGAAAPVAGAEQRGNAGYPVLARLDAAAPVVQGSSAGLAPARDAVGFDVGSDGGVGAGVGGGVAPVSGAGGLRANVARALQDRPRAAAPKRLAELAQVVGWAARPEGRAGGSASGERRMMAAPGMESEGGFGGVGGSSAAAPSPPERGAEGGGVGTVMLDGRVVGQWLSERMARDAARPGAGTTFFDPRQAPAWTPSGAL